MEFTLESVSNWRPNVLSILESNIQAPLYYLDHELRHPLAIYNISYSTVIENFNRVTRALYKEASEKLFLDPAKYTWDTELLAYQKDLLYALMEHFDDCENILACFISPDKNRSQNRHIKSFKKDTKEYRDHIGRVVNTLKHRQGRLRSIVLLSDKLAMPGYYVEGPLADKTIGPDKTVHPGGKGAFSYSRDLKYHFYHFHAVAEHLGEAIKNITSTNYVLQPSKTAKPDLRLLELAIMISNIPPLFYPDEALKPIPTVLVDSSNRNEEKITLKYPDTNFQSMLTPKKFQVLVSYKGDGVTKSFKFPYLAADKPQATDISPSDPDQNR